MYDMKNLIILLLGALALSTFSCTSTIPLSVLQPAEITIPDHINIIAVADRSKPSKGFNNVAESILSGEGLGQDRRGRQRAIEALTTTLTRTPRFQVRHTGLEMEGTKASQQMPPPLEWAQVEQICRDFSSDALLTIEQYDSDNNISMSTSTEKVKKDGQETTRIVHHSRLDTRVLMGWRFYDPQRRIIVDEFSNWEETTDYGRGYTEQAARNNLPSQTNVTEAVSHLAGEHYGMRIAPVWITVQREWFSKGKRAAKEPMERAARYAKAGEWERAAEIWRTLTANPPDHDTGGRAAYNMAVANEREGKLNSALEWAQKAYTDFGNKKASNYVNILKMRLNDQRKVASQLPQT